jgi:hypothetical protein
MYQNPRLEPGLRGIRPIREHVVQLSHGVQRSFLGVCSLRIWRE